MAARSTTPPTRCALVPKDKRVRLAHSFIDVLADLHASTRTKPGLSDLGKKDDYIGRQLKTWYRSWQASIEPALDDPRAHTLQKYFLENTPDQGPARLVHGDYGFAQLPRRPRLHDRRRRRLGDLDAGRSARRPRLRAEPVAGSDPTRRRLCRMPPRAARLPATQGTGPPLCRAHRTRSVEARLLRRLQPLEVRRDHARRLRALHGRQEEHRRR
jgi:hypothetical protein